VVGEAAAVLVRADGIAAGVAAGVTADVTAGVTAGVVTAEGPFAHAAASSAVSTDAGNSDLMPTGLPDAFSAKGERMGGRPDTLQS